MNAIVRLVWWLALSAALLLPALAVPARAAAAVADPSPEVAYLKLVNAWRPPSDPQLLFLLMAQFANAGRHAEGIDYFEGVRKRFDAQLDDTQRALYLTAVASLRAGHAGEVALLRRIGWVRETIALLDEATRLTGGQVFVVRWMSGVVRAQLPRFFGQRDAAMRDLRWCVEHVERAPHANWLREVHFHLAALHLQRGETDDAQRAQAASGYAIGARPVVFTTPFASAMSTGHTFSPRAIREAVPGTVYVLSGFEFTEFHFVVSADRRQLISIDAGTRADSARAAHEALRQRVPDLPPLTTVLVTHAHWDHVGGHAYFRSLGPQVRFIGRGNYADELRHDATADKATLRRFFGEAFSLDDVLAYKPDQAIDRPTDLTIGGTRFSLLPTRGGETDDALLIHLPEHGVLFVGDILMPYFGAPFVEEGSIDGLLESIAQLSRLAPRQLLHGHEPLTRIYSSTAMLDDLAVQLAWLRDEVRRGIAAGLERAAIQQANLVPPSLQHSPSNVHLAYLLMRENAINRLFDQHSGYWQNGMYGLDALTDADRGTALLDYLGVSDTRLAQAGERMVADGRHELAAALLGWGLARRPDSAALAAAHRLAYLKLMEKYQEYNPFKFIVYAGRIEQPTPQVDTP